MYGKVQDHHTHSNLLSQQMATTMETKNNTVDVQGLDDDVKDEILKLISEDGQIYEVPKKIAIMSELIKTMAEGGNINLTNTLYIFCMLCL